MYSRILNLMFYYILKYFVGHMQYFHGIHPESVILTDIAIYVHRVTILNFFEDICMHLTPHPVCNVFYIILLLMMRKLYFFS